MALSPPEQRIWWNEKIGRGELVWVFLAFLWGVIMFLMMAFWHVAGDQNLSKEVYRTDPATYEAKTIAFADKFKIREEEGVPVAKPQPGGDVYMLARLWEWWPVLELQKGQSYRLHLSSLDWQHGFSLQPVNMNIQVHPNLEHVITLTPTEAGVYGVVCNEFCGPGHHTMVGRIYVVE